MDNPLVSHIPTSAPANLELELSENGRPIDIGGSGVIGEGSFGRVYIFPFGWPEIAYKESLSDCGGETLRHELEMCSELGAFTGNKSDDPASFVCPAAWRLFKPQAAMGFGPGEPAIVPRPTLEMNRIPSLHADVVKLYKDTFINGTAVRRAFPTRLLRLYLGRVYAPDTTGFSDAFTFDLPLDAHRYSTLTNRFPLAPAITSIAAGMGQLLARMHWGVGIDARGVKLVLGGSHADSVPNWQCWAFHFSKCDRWLVPRPFECLHFNTLTNNKYPDLGLDYGARCLAHVISRNELYYPRPRDTRLYTPFKTAYLKEVQSLLNFFEAHIPGYLNPQGHRMGFAKWKPRIQSAAGEFFRELEMLDEMNQRGGEGPLMMLLATAAGVGRTARADAEEM